jgi:hypothetical protein
VVACSLSLRAEFEPGALQASVSGKVFVEMHRLQLRDGGELAKDLLKSSEAVTQKILGAKLSQKSTRSLIQSLFDHLMSSDLTDSLPAHLDR